MTRHRVVLVRTPHPLTRMLPSPFLDRIRALLLAEEVKAFLEALATPPPGLRVNEVRLAPEAFEALVPFRAEPLAYPPAGFTVGPDERPGAHPYHAAGLYYLQDPGAMAVAALVAPRPGERVLDLAAAPGGKTTHLAALMRNEGVLVANDVSAKRARELVGNVERCGVRNAIVLSESAGRLADFFGAAFDRVLLDAPCSGESMFHKSAAAREGWSEAGVAGCARRQADLIARAGEMVRPGGLLVYSTCTFSVEENEEVAAGFLAGGDFEPAALPEVPGAEAVGARASGGEPTAFRLWPHRVPGAGHFVAAFRRTRGGDEDRWESAAPDLPPGIARDWQAFGDGAYAGYLDERAQLTQHGADLFALPPGAPDLRGLRVLRAGLHCGTLRPGRFEPAHALALGIPPSASTLDLEAGDRRVDLYLRGHPIAAPGNPGWIPVAVDGFALGWGKRVGGTVKNHYPKGLRRRG